MTKLTAVYAKTHSPLQMVANIRSYSISVDKNMLDLLNLVNLSLRLKSLKVVCK